MEMFLPLLKLLFIIASRALLRFSKYRFFPQLKNSSKKNIFGIAHFIGLFNFTIIVDFKTPNGKFKKEK